MEVADLHPIRREHSARAIAIVISHEDRTGARYYSDDHLAVLRRRKRTKKPAAILLVDHQREWNAGKSRFARLGIKMMGASAKDDRMTVTFPCPAHLRHLGLGGGDGRREHHGEHRSKRRDCTHPGSLSHW